MEDYAAWAIEEYLKGSSEHDGLSLLELGLLLQFPESFNELLQGGDQNAVSVVKVEDGNVSSPVAVEVIGIASADLTSAGLLRLHQLDRAIEVVQNLSHVSFAVNLCIIKNNMRLDNFGFFVVSNTLPQVRGPCRGTV